MDAYFVTCKDGNKTAYLLGPFYNKNDCEQYSQWKEDNPRSKLPEIIKACTDIDKKAHFFSYGMCKISEYETCLITGILNKQFPIPEVPA